MKSVLSILRDGGDRQKVGVSQFSVPSWGQKPRAQDQGRHRFHGKGQSPTGQVFFCFIYYLFLVWRLSSSEWAWGIILGKGSESSFYSLHAGLWEDKVDKKISLFLERGLDFDGARDWGVEPCSLSPPV